MADAERDHWWFKGRREFIEAAIRRVAPRNGAVVLDAGCGSGGNLQLLSEFGTVHGFEFDDEARAAAIATGLAAVEFGALPDQIPFGSTGFDLIGLFDVLEHLAQPVESLRALGSRLADRGAIVLTVPANPWLWGPHDVHSHHHRRYTAASLREHVAQAGLSVEYVSYFNSLLLPLAILQRARERFVGYSTDTLMLSGPFNELLLRIWRVERLWIPRVSAPFGLSLLAIVRRPDARMG
ncbi:MAG TPA: class I SAM-dependent methyltransferase [Gemmatimonadaceae bacterium]|nr:class I SAM-dependent methyltransferase [Gemmatimonadaceae bacterium]